MAEDLKAEALTCAPLLQPKVAPPMRRHIQAISPGLSSHSPIDANDDIACGNVNTGSPIADEHAKVSPRTSKRIQSVYGPQEADVAVPRMRWRVMKRIEQSMYSLPLWLLNGVTAVGVWLCFANLQSSELAQNLLSFALFALVLPLLLIWMYGRAAANTHAAWNALNGVTDGKLQLLQGLQLLLLFTVVALSFFVTLYTSSSRFSRWLRCQWTWLPEHKSPSDGWYHGSFQNSTDNLTWIPLQAGANATHAELWQCGDNFFA